MEERIYDYWAASLQDGYIASLTDITERAGGARALYEMPEERLRTVAGVSKKLADHILASRPPESVLEKEYYKMMSDGISYVNHTDPDFPQKLRDIASPPYGLFVKGCLPAPDVPTVAIIGARGCSEYGRLMAQYFGDRLAKEGVQIVSGMAAGIDGIAQEAAVSAGGHSFAVLGCGVDVVYPAGNRGLYRKLCENGNGVMSEYAPQRAAIPRQFPPRNRIISGLCDVIIVVEARQKSGTLITVDFAIEQGRTVMIVPGRLTDTLSAGCLNLLYQGALPATDIGSVLEQLGMSAEKRHKDDTPEKAMQAPELQGTTKKIASLLTIEPQSAEIIAELANLPHRDVIISLTKLEMLGIAREVWPGYFIRIPASARH